MSDLISRKAAIDAVAEGLKNTFIEYRDVAEKMIGKIPSAQHWIPCSERLPEEDEQVFVYLFDDSPYIAWFCGGRWHTEEFTLDKDDEPTAWMPLPALYEERQEETKQINSTLDAIEEKIMQLPVEIASPDTFTEPKFHPEDWREIL